jgi:uroporphyrinogen-III synthase
MSTLAGKIIISTRPLTEDDSIKNHLTAKGACVLDFPMIKTCGIELTVEQTAILRAINEYEWIVFTSKNGVIRFYKQLNALNIDQKVIATTKIAVIGKSTGEEVLKHNESPFLISSGKTSEDLLAEIQKEIKPCDKILLVLGELAEDKLEKGLVYSCIVHRINVYKTIELEYTSNDIIDWIRDDNYQMILFTSPSGFRNFNRIMLANNISSNIRAACIGKTTEMELLKNNCSPLVVSPKSDAESFVNEIEKYLASPNSSKGGKIVL